MVAVVPQAIVFMKVGVHGREPLQAIFERKAKEETAAGVIFWGYGGTLCHPTRQIRPFAERCKASGLSISVVMVATPSKFNTDPTVANAFSEDGANPRPIPRGVEIKSSRYALIMGDLRPNEMELDLSSYVVAVGPSEGRRLSEYIRGHVDKGCAIQATPVPPRTPIRVAFTAVLVPPFAVFLH